MFLLLSAGCLVIFTGSKAWAHSGQTHDVELQISLPEVTASVNNTNIKKDAIIRELKRTLRSYKKRGKTLTPVQQKTAAKKLIDDEIGRTLLVQKGEKLGISVTPEMVQKKLGKIKSGFKSDAVFEHKLKDSGMTLDEYREELRVDLIMDRVIKKEVEPQIKIDEKDLKAYYDKNIGRFRTGDKVRASVILIKIPKTPGAEGENMAREKIESILKRVREGTDFADLAQRFSQDSIASRGGDLGFFSKNQMLKAFSNRAFNMKVGEVSDIFRTNHGFHILKVTDKKPGLTRTFESEKENIRKILKEKKLAQATRAYVQALKKKADLKTYF
ncbi:MAG: peptidylprolyl isomerase [Nitrospinaceae bacterium]